MRARFHLGLYISLAFFPARILSAQDFDKDLQLHAFLAIFNPIVHSFAKATLFDAQGRRVYKPDEPIGRMESKLRYLHSNRIYRTARTNMDNILFRKSRCRVAICPECFT